MVFTARGKLRSVHRAGRTKRFQLLAQSTEVPRIAPGAFDAAARIHSSRVNRRLMTKLIRAGSRRPRQRSEPSRGARGCRRARLPIAPGCSPHRRLAADCVLAVAHVCVREVAASGNLPRPPRSGVRASHPQGAQTGTSCNLHKQLQSEDGGAVVCAHREQRDQISKERVVSQRVLSPWLHAARSFSAKPVTSRSARPSGTPRKCRIAEAATASPSPSYQPISSSRTQGLRSNLGST